MRVFIDGEVFAEANEGETPEKEEELFEGVLNEEEFDIAEA